MSTLKTQYQNYLKENPESKFTFEEWSDWKFSNSKLPPLHNGLRSIGERTEELSNCEVTPITDPEKDSPYISDDFQIGPNGAYEHIEYSIPIYENGIKTSWTIDGIIGDEKYFELLKYGNGKDLPDMVNVGVKR